MSLKEFLDSISDRKSTISDKEAKLMLELSEKLRKEFKMRELW